MALGNLLIFVIMKNVINSVIRDKLLFQTTSCFNRLEREKSNTVQSAIKVFLHEEIFKNRASLPIANKIFLIAQSLLNNTLANFQSNLRFLKAK